MYNEEQKMRFITERSTEAILPNNFLKLIFDISEPFEVEYNKDICQFTSPEILSFYRVQNIKSLDRITNINSQLNCYAGWCMQQNLIKDGMNHFAEMNLDILNSCVNRFALESSIMTRDQVLDVIRQFKNYRDKFVVLMLFETGKSKELSNILKVRPSDFTRNKCTLPDGREVNISFELYNIVDGCKNEYVYQTYVVNPYRKWHAERELVDTGYVFKDVGTAVRDNYTALRTRLGNQMKRVFDYVGLPFSTKLNSFVESGIIWDIITKANSLNITPEELLYNIELRGEIEYQHGIKIGTKHYLRKYGKYLG